MNEQPKPPYPENVVPPLTFLLRRSLKEAQKKSKEAA